MIKQDESEKLEETELVFKKWSPKRLTADDIFYIVQGYGFDNDSLECGKSDTNKVEWEITIKIKHSGGDNIWP